MKKAAHQTRATANFWEAVKIDAYLVEKDDVTSSWKNVLLQKEKIILHQQELNSSDLKRHRCRGGLTFETTLNALQTSSS